MHVSGTFLLFWAQGTHVPLYYRDGESQWVLVWPAGWPVSVKTAILSLPPFTYELAALGRLIKRNQRLVNFK